MLPQVSELGNNSQLEADTDVSHGTRKRKRNSEKWARNIRKKKVQSGEATESACGYGVATTTSRSRPFRCTSSKGYKCSEFSEEESFELFKNYGHLSDSVYRRWIYFLTIMVDRIKISRLSQSLCSQQFCSY